MWRGAVSHSCPRRAPPPPPPRPSLAREQRFKAEEMGKSTPQNADARADDPLSDPKNRAEQGGQ